MAVKGEDTKTLPNGDAAVTLNFTDIILRTSDNVHFYVIGNFLSVCVPVFQRFVQLKSYLQYDVSIVRRFAPTDIWRMLNSPHVLS